MRIQRQDLINKLEALVGEIKQLSKTKLLNSEYYQDLCEEVTEWIEDIRKEEVEFIND